MNSEAQLERIRLAGNAARHALQQLRQEAAEGLSDESCVAMLRLLHDDVAPAGSIVNELGDLITEISKPLGESDDADSEYAVCQLDEAASYVQDYAGQRLEKARISLAPRTPGL